MWMYIGFRCSFGFHLSGGFILVYLEAGSEPQPIKTDAKAAVKINAAIKK
jgi:hypothetical protein